MMRRTVIAAALAVQSGAAWAQAGPDINDATIVGQQINAAVDRSLETGRPRGEEAGETIDGEAGVFVLKVNEIFLISASTSLGFTTNPERTADSLGSSFYNDTALSAGIATVLGGKFDLGLSATLAGREFFEDFAPSNRTASGNLSLGTAIGNTPLYVGVTGFGGYNFERDFTRGTSFYGTSASLSAALPLGRRLLLRPGVGATRQWSGISENNSTSVSASIDALAALSPRVTASVRAAVVRRWYDDFYEDVTFVERVDMAYQLGAALAWRPAERVSLAINAGFEKQDSRFFLSDYDAFDAGIGVAFNLRF